MTEIAPYWDATPTSHPTGRVIPPALLPPHFLRLFRWAALRCALVQPSAATAVMTDAKEAAAALEGETYVTDVLARTGSLSPAEFVALEAAFEVDEATLDLATDGDAAEAYMAQYYLGEASPLPPRSLLVAYLSLGPLSTASLSPARVMCAIQHVVERHAKACLFDVWCEAAKQGGLTVPAPDALQTMLAYADSLTFFALPAAPLTASRLSLLADYVAAWPATVTVSEHVAAALFRGLAQPLARSAQVAPLVSVRRFRMFA